MDANNIILLTINIVIIMLFAVVLVFIIYTYKQNVNLIKTQRDDINKLILYIRYFDSVLLDIIQSEKNNSASIDDINKYSTKIRNITDLDEFKNLSPELKDKYKKYVVDKIMIAFTDYANENKNALTDQELQDSVNLIISNLKL